MIKIILKVPKNSFLEKTPGVQIDFHFNLSKMVVLLCK